MRVGLIVPGVLLLASSLGGCATAPLHLDDQTFVRAQARLARVSDEVERAKASAPERHLFMQAEGFYEYRFGFAPHSALSDAAQLAAAVTDFPVFQSLAGSVDLVDLRLRAYDGAVLLWETLLARYPHTALRPLALYRLGWAYRSAGAEGLPRRSGDDAFKLLIKEQPNTPLAGLSKEAEAVAWKSKNTATALSLIPGLGQIYVHEYWNGVLRLSVGLGGAAMVIAPAVIAIERGHDLSWSHDWPLLLTGAAGLVVLSIDYTTAYQDAIRGVVEFNERREATFLRAHPNAP